MRVGSTRRRKVFYSWKQIAYHLGCNERTCLRWEKELGLPVHRMTTSSKSRVFAYKDELDGWIRENIDANSKNAKPPSSSLASLGRTNAWGHFLFWGAILYPRTSREIQGDYQDRKSVV